MAVAFALAGGGHPRRALLLALAALWALRLGGHLLWRNAGRGEDPRYQAMRRHHGARFAALSLVTRVRPAGRAPVDRRAPAPARAARARPRARSARSTRSGLAVFALGLCFEAVGDWQLARFKADPANAGRVMDRGLWRYTRHPNYFGDCAAHWGMFVVALATPWGWLGVLGPLAMTVLLLRVSGVALLERSIGKRRPGLRRLPAAHERLPPLAAAELSGVGSWRGGRDSNPQLPT